MGLRHLWRPLLEIELCEGEKDLFLPVGLFLLGTYNHCIAQSWRSGRTYVLSSDRDPHAVKCSSPIPRSSHRGNTILDLGTSMHAVSMINSMTLGQLQDKSGGKGRR